MGEFIYEGVDRSGKRVSGKLEVPSEVDLRMALRAQGIRPTKVSKPSMLTADLGSMFRGGGLSVPTSTVVTFTRQLQLLVSSGIPLLQAIEVLGDQAVHPGMKSVLLVIKEKVSGGTYLWEALSGYPDVFPKLYVALIRAGEASGSVDQMLKRLAKYLEDADRSKKMLKSAMIYPLILIGVGVGVISLMMIFVIPKFEQMLKESNQELPGPTKMIIALSHFMTNNIFFLVAALVVGVYLVSRYLRSQEGMAFRDRVLFEMPLFGSLVQKAGVARFARTLQTLIVSGVNLIDAIDICRATIGNAVLEESVAKVRGEVEAGKTLGSVLNRLPVFPKMAVQMVMVGEASGNLDKTLDKLADFFDTEVEIAIQGLTKAIEPLLLLILGGAVAGLMIAMYLPIFQLAGSAGQ